MLGKNNRTQSRRNVIRKASLTGLASVPILSSSATARSDKRKMGKNGYVINENGFLEYHGPKDDPHIQSAVEGMNQAKREGNAKFVLEDGQVVAKSTTADTLNHRCDGANSYSREVNISGIEHQFHLDSCKTSELVDLLIKGAAASQVAAILLGVSGNLAAAAAAECAAVLLGASTKLITSNHNGEGVIIYIPLPASPIGPITSLDVDPQ